MAFARPALVVAVVLLAAGCGASETTELPGGVTIPNQGGDMEGHTPTGFAGSGTGLFAGDNLNSSFPDGQGVQAFLTFSLPSSLVVGSAAGSVVVTSDALHTIGTPFDDLGHLTIEPVSYTAFGPQLFDLAGLADPVSCTASGDTVIECDVTAAVTAAIDAGQATVQFRVRFEQAADNDGEPDLALFYGSDSNTNETGLFELVITAG